MSERLNRAIAFATEAHNGAVRKITLLPYILHPMEVAANAASITTDEDVIIAALLHDTVEDAGVLPETLVREFGQRVADLVASETEDKMNHLPKSASWKARKEGSLQILRNTEDEGVKMLWLSDKLANMRSLYADWLKNGDNVFLHFHVTDKSLHAWYYRSIAELTQSLKDSAAWQEYNRLVELVYREIK